MRRKTEIVVMVLVVTVCIFLGKNIGEYVASAKVKTEKMVVVLDPGHGGSDPGKIGINQCEEKEINLKIAQKVREKLEEKDVKVIMTRTEDKGLSSENASNHKAEDMKKRVEIINESDAQIAVSIHQNSYTSEEVKGAQVFYFAHSEEGKKMAEIMQENFRLFDPENKRMAKENTTYYMLKKTEKPSIIVECGFLSNHSEAEKLVTEDYQEKVSEVICDGIMKILQQEM